ncbi:hypothetical protein [Natronorubrum sp. FCH18a]|uniref:hypothetical protein n=1 Tax=Natronorubrum sp. FCH18a TaxID=3447018 RepID=UPI003F50E39C
MSRNNNSTGSKVQNNNSEEKSTDGIGNDSNPKDKADSDDGTDRYELNGFNIPTNLGDAYLAQDLSRDMTEGRRSGVAFVFRRDAVDGTVDEVEGYDKEIWFEINPNSSEPYRVTSEARYYKAGSVTTTQLNSKDYQEAGWAMRRLVKECGGEVEGKTFRQTGGGR